MSIVVTAIRCLVGSMKKPMKKIKSTRKGNTYLRKLKLLGKCCSCCQKIVLYDVVNFWKNTHKFSANILLYSGFSLISNLH
ncbi:uncharacterized protein LOC131655016, partial [Vicia villosa]|uniref:uncharacterized protein LOC131655016 n=1 Tax=Vicia villosa TaxID=3911 RepID=UPI00273B505E